MNTIKVDKKYLLYMGLWKEENEKDILKMDLHLPFNEFIIEYHDSSKLKIKSLGNNRCKIYGDGFEINAKIQKGLQKLKLDKLHLSLNVKPKKIMHLFEDLLINLQIILLFFTSTNKETRYTKILDIIKVKTRGKGKSIKKYKPAVKKTNNSSIKLLSTKKTRVIKEESSKTYNRHTDTWDVRGHYRHYKGGKVVWVNSYKKGNGGKSTSKIYKI